MTDHVDLNGASCRRCGRSLSRKARFCGQCGAATADQRSVLLEGRNGALQETRWHSAAIAVVFVGTLAGLAGSAALFDSESPTVAALGALVAQVAAGIGGLVVLAALAQKKGSNDHESRALGSALRRLWRETLGGAPSPRALVCAPLVGCAAFGVAHVWVSFILREAAVEPLNPGLVAAAVFGAPLVEEWVDRGVLWRALEPLTSERGRVFVSAALFALAHGLGGGWVLEFPHRFVGALALGLLRGWSRSLAPPLLAHMTWNALAVTV